MSSTARWIGEPRIYPVNKELSTQKYFYEIDEIEVRVKYRREHSSGRGFYVTLTPQNVRKRENYTLINAEYMLIRTKKLLGCKRYSRKAEREALNVLKEFEPYWVAEVANECGLIIQDSPIYRSYDEEESE